MPEPDDYRKDLPPITRSLIGSVKMPKDMDYKEAIAEYLVEKYFKNDKPDSEEDNEHPRHR